MTKKDQFRAIRRAYRLARKVSPLAHENAVALYMSTVSALRTFTGKLEAYYRMNRLEGDKKASDYVKGLFGELPDTPAPDQPVDDETIEVSIC
jgi:hypothetical protein